MTPNAARAATRVGLTVGALLYGVWLSNLHTPYFVAVMLAAIWRHE